MFLPDNEIPKYFHIFYCLSHFTRYDFRLLEFRSNSGVVSLLIMTVIRKQSFEKRYRYDLRLKSVYIKKTLNFRNFSNSTTLSDTHSDRYTEIAEGCKWNFMLSLCSGTRVTEGISHESYRGRTSLIIISCK